MFYARLTCGNSNAFNSFHIMLIKWHGFHHSESLCAVKFQVWSIPIYKMTRTWSLLLPLLSTFLPYHTHWENNTPTSASTLPTCYLCDTIECVKGCCQMSHCNLLLGKHSFHQEIFIMSGVWIYSLSYLHHVWEVPIWNHGCGPVLWWLFKMFLHSWKTQDVFISEHIELQRVHLCGH